jgi:hypothetical protein
MAADPDFLFKLCVECSIDAVIILGVNYAARGENFFSELEFAFCQVRFDCKHCHQHCHEHALSAGTAYRGAEFGCCL